MVRWCDGTSTAGTPPPPLAKWLEPAFYMLGASYFNSKDWPNSVTTFNRYLKLFPQSPRVAEITYSLAQAQLLGGHPEEAIPLLKTLLPLETYHQRCVMLLAECYKRNKDLPGAISVFETEKKRPNLDPDYLGKINLKLLGLYEDAANIESAFALVREIDADIEHSPDVVDFNALATHLGDTFLEKNRVTDALSCYRRVRDNKQVIELAKLQITSLQSQMAANLVRIQADPLNTADLQTYNSTLKTQIEKDQGVLTQYLTLPPILPPLLLRIGRAYSLAGQYWEAAVVFREIRRRYPSQSEAESALYGSIIVFDKVKQDDRALALCHDYLTQYPQGKYADTIGYMRGALAYDAEMLDQAVGYFEDCLKSQPNNPHREQIELILGDIQLRQAQFGAAIAAYQKFQADFPDSSRIEAAVYRSALALLFGGKNEEADTAIRAYMTKYPSGNYVADAAYRLDVIKYSAKQYDTVIADGLAWQQKYGKAQPLAEVLSLMGDAYASTGRPDDAVKAYTASYKAAQTPEVLSYSLFAAAKILQKEANWPAIGDMFQEFMKANPESPLVVESIVWIGRADVKLGKVQEARQVMADAAKQYLNDPTREGVDEILTQMALLYGKNHLATAPAAPPISGGASATPTGASSTPTGASSTPTGASAPPTADLNPTAPANDPAKDLEDALTIPDLDKKATAQARIIYAKSELARIHHKPDIEGQFLLDIAAKFKPEDLSPALLAQVGDCLLQNGQPDRAAVYYHYLLDEYDKSPLVDFAYNGLGQIAYDQKKYTEALKYYSTALDKGLASAKQKEITLGQAQTLLALKRYDEAKPVFEEVASNRAWRGVATALSVFSLGEIQMDQAKYAEANAFYQRVFVAYQKYPDIQAKAYLRSGEAFENLGKTTEAASTYREMLNNPNLANFPEVQDAKHRLENLSVSQK